MQELTLSKKLKIIKLYFNGFSYDEIAKRTGISKGTVANVIADLKAGQFPEISSIPEEIEQLRDLSIDIKRSGISPTQATIGLSLISRLKDMGVEPVDIERCHTLLQALSSPDNDLKEMAKSVLAVEKIRQETGLTLNELEAKVIGLREESKRLEPLSEEIRQKEKELAELETSSFKLNGKIQELSNHHNSLTNSISNLELKESKLVSRVTDLEERAYAADKQLSEARRDLETLDKIGMSVQELNRFTVKLKEVSAHHDIKPEDLYHHLLKELKQLDKGLSLECSVKEREAQLARVRNEIAKEQAEKESLHTYLNQLTLEKTRLEARLDQYRKQLAQDINALSSASEKAVREINDSLKSGIEQGLMEVNKLAEEALRVGKEVCKLKADTESLSWVKPLLLLVRGSNELDDHEVKAIGLAVLRSISSWLNDNHGEDWNLNLLRSNIESSISGLEKWKPSTT